MSSNGPNQTDDEDNHRQADESTEGSAAAVAADAAGEDGDENELSPPAPNQPQKIEPEEGDEEDPAAAETLDESPEADESAPETEEEASEAGDDADEQAADAEEADEQAPGDEAADQPEDETDEQAADEPDDEREAADEPDDEREAADEQDDEQDDEPEYEPELTVPEFTDLSGQGAEWLAGLFERMNFEAEAEVTDEDGDPHVDIRGADAARLLGAGKLGPKAIEGIETLMQSVFSEDDTARDLYVDVDGRRAERKEMLQRVAAEMADRAVELHKTVTVSGLNSTERRIIHRQLRDHDGVDTESVGDGIFRRLRIEPTG